MRVTEVTVNSAGYITLSWREHQHARYLAEESPDGIITLTPAALVPAMVKNPKNPLTGKTSLDEVRARYAQWLEGSEEP